MNVVIVEDEQLAAEALAAIIQRLRPQTAILAILGSVEEAVQWFTLHQTPDLVFCDIHLSDGNSFDIFRTVEIKSPVIFTTAYDSYAIEAFKVNSVDYLLKPIKAEDVAKALKKHEDLQKHQFVHGLQNIQNLVQSSQPRQTGTRSRFLVKQGQAIKALPVEEVAYFLAEEGVVFLYSFQGKRFTINYTLEQLEEQLDPAKFFRINRHFMVNVEAVQEVRPYFKGRLYLVVKPELKQELIISSSRASSFKQWLDL